MGRVIACISLEIPYPHGYPREIIVKVCELSEEILQLVNSEIQQSMEKAPISHKSNLKIIFHESSVMIAVLACRFKYPT